MIEGTRATPLDSKSIQIREIPDMYGGVKVEPASDITGLSGSVDGRENTIYRAMIPRTPNHRRTDDHRTNPLDCRCPHHQFRLASTSNIFRRNERIIFRKTVLAPFPIGTLGEHA